ncbi:MAG: UDP-4-amino-4-deoxy-L-arabinose--oxoglutarate aminotransferase [Phycisphaerae bacterium]|nr:UDP-4-amino-4-deoxy-L-arabinose--oxoglutarate aminotransferase [Phycisphaerae bacterium]
MRPAVAMPDVFGCEPAILGGPRAVPQDHADLFAWPIITPDDERAVLQVLRAGTMSGDDVSQLFEQEFAAWQGARHALTFENGTTALLVAMWAAGIGRGDEMICPSMTYWASCLQLFSLGATPVFADIQPDTLCIDPDDIERHITPRTRAIMVVHYCGHPCDMEAIMAVARRHSLPVIEDVSHAQGSLCRGRKAGTFGLVSAASLMTAKSLPAGEGGVLWTDDETIFQRALAFGNYRRNATELTAPDLRPFAGLPLGQIKGRMNQMSAALVRTQLARYDRRIAGIQSAMNRFWDLLEGTPGLRPHRPAAGLGSTMGGWYNPLGHYLPEELGGLPVERFIAAVQAEGGRGGRGCNTPLHLHPMLNAADIYRDGRPTRIAHSDRDLRQGPGSLPVTEALASRCLGVPWFKHDRPDEIALYAAAFRKVALSADKLAAAPA